MATVQRSTKALRYLLTLLLLGLAIYLLLPQLTSLEQAIAVLRQMSPLLVLLAIGTQVASYWGSGYLLQTAVHFGVLYLLLVHELSSIQFFAFLAIGLSLPLFAAITSAFLAEWIDAVVVLLVVLSSTGLSFWQEHRASSAVAKLQARVKSKAIVLRNGQPQTIVTEEIVTGDVVLLSAGSLIPADSERLFCQPGGAYRRNLSGGKETRSGNGEYAGRAHQLCLYGHFRAQRHSAGGDCTDRRGHRLWPDRPALNPSSTGD